MRTKRTLALGMAAVLAAGCSSSVTEPTTPSAARKDGAYLGAGYNVQPPPSDQPPASATADTTQRGGAYLGAGY